MPKKIIQNDAIGRTTKYYIWALSLLASVIIYMYIIYIYFLISFEYSVYNP